jgi:hypothetical protein
MTSARPCATSIIASVAMNGGSRRSAMLKPLMSPISPPNRTAPSTPERHRQADVDDPARRR